MDKKQPLTFARFLVLPENRSAWMAVRWLADGFAGRGASKNAALLYLHGSPGTGKTHLTSALVSELTRRDHALVVTRLQAADFATEDADGHSSQGDSDLVIVEDLQFLRPQVAESLIDLLDDCQRRGIPTLLTGTQSPRELNVSGRLSNRLAGGLVTALESLQASSRLALLADKAQRRQLAVPREVLAWLAKNLKGNGRQVEAALGRLENLALTHDRSFDLRTIAALFQDETSDDRKSMERIAQRVGGHFRVSIARLRSAQRARKVLLPRQVSMYLARQVTGLSLDQIGSFFGGRDHSTVLHACRKVEQALAADPALHGTIRQLQTELL